MNELAVIIPVYNEEACIDVVISKWTSELQRLRINFQIHAYNDGSKDGTLHRLNELAGNNKNLTVHDKRNSGHGPTIIQGYRDNSSTEWIFQIDSDNETEPDMFEELWTKRHSYDFLIGRRLSFDDSIVRRFMSFMSRFVVRTFYGSRVYDVNLPYRLMKSEKFKDLFFALPDDTFAPNLIVSGIASIKKLNVYEVPLQKRKRTTGKVSIQKMKLLKVALKSFVQTILFRFALKNKLKI